MHVQTLPFKILLLTILGQGHGMEDEDECSVEESTFINLQNNMDKLVRLTKKHICQAAKTTTTTSTIAPKTCLLDSTLSFLKEAGVKVWVSVGDWNAAMNFVTMSKSEDGRISFAKSATALTEKYRFDGFMPNWQYPACPLLKCSITLLDEIKYFAQLMTELSSRLSPKGVSVLAHFHGSHFITLIDWKYKDVDIITELKEVVDFWVLECMRSAGSWTGRTADTNPFPMMKMCLEMYIKLIPRQNIVLMVPATLDPMILIDETKTSFSSPTEKINGDTSLRSLRGACNLVNNNGKLVVRMDTNHPYSYAFKGKDWVSMENTFTMRMRMEVAVKSNISGVCLHHVENDDHDGEACGGGKFPLLRTINEEFRGTGKCKLPNLPQPNPN